MNSSMEFGHDPEGNGKQLSILRKGVIESDFLFFFFSIFFFFICSGFCHTLK